MTDSSKYCVILAGGAGSRMWPISKVSFPKQFLEVSGTGKTFLELTYERFCTIVPPENILIVTASRYQSLVKDLLPEVPDENVLLEPYARNTAPATAYAAYTILKRDPDATVVVTPCDHIIFGDSEFRSSILSAMDFVAANDGVIMTLGVVPTRPDTNFGYIQAVGGRNAYEKGEPLPVKTFTEKPDKELAAIFMESGEFLWNSGIFVWRASAIKDELEKLSPSITKLWLGWRDFIGTPREGEELQRIYSDVERISIDYAVMEKTDIAWVYPGKFDWADIGNWQALYENIPDRDSDGNALKLDGKSILKENSRSILIQKNKGKLTAVKGLEDYIVYDSEDILFICPRDEESVKDFISDSAMPQFEEYR